MCKPRSSCPALTGVQGDATLAAAEGVLERLPGTDEIPARMAAAQVRLAVSRRIGDLDAALAAIARAETLLGEITGSQLARHPEIHAQVLAGRGAVELWSGDFDRAAATLRSAIAPASAPGETYERSDCLGYLALVEALCGRLSHVAELADQATGAAEDHLSGACRVRQPGRTIALARVHLERNELRQAHGQLKLAEGALRIAPDKLLGAIACLIAALPASRRQYQGRGGHAQAVARDRAGRLRSGWSNTG